MWDSRLNSRIMRAGIMVSFLESITLRVSKRAMNGVCGPEYLTMLIHSAEFVSKERFDSLGWIFLEIVCDSFDCGFFFDS